MCSLRTKSKFLLSYVVYYSGLFRVFLACLPKKCFLVLTYHRIIPRIKGGRFLQPGMYVEPETFEAHLMFVKHYFDVRSVSDLCNEPLAEKAPCSGKHKCYLTFDDGWKDFYQYAYPLLVKHQVPVTVFLPTDFMGSKKLFWTDRIGFILEFIEQQGRFEEFREYIIGSLGLTSRGASWSPERLFEETIYELKKLREKYINRLIDSLEERFDLPPSCESNTFLNWEQVVEMRLSGLVTFGSHTKSHQILTHLTEEEVRIELQSSRDCLMQRGVVLDDRVAFCYPNGNYNDIVSGQLKDEKYTCAFTTHCGWNNNETPTYQLKRVGLHQEVSFTPSLLGYSLISNYLELNKQFYNSSTRYRKRRD